MLYQNMFRESVSKASDDRELKPWSNTTFNTICLIFILQRHSSRIFQNQWRINEFQDLKVTIFIKRRTLLCRPALIKGKQFSAEVFYTKTNQSDSLHENGCAFNTRIKCFNNQNYKMKLKWRTSFVVRQQTFED